VSNLRVHLSSLSLPEASVMSTQKKAKKSRTRQRTSKPVRRLPATIMVDVPVPKRTTDIITEKTYVTTEPEVEIRRPATLAQALTEPVVAIVKPKSKVRKQVTSRIRRSA
jgi:hypothetical protein